jgi:hypothetical protein
MTERFSASSRNQERIRFFAFLNILLSLFELCVGLMAGAMQQLSLRRCSTNACCRRTSPPNCQIPLRISKRRTHNNTWRRRHVNSQALREARKLGMTAAGNRTK